MLITLSLVFCVFFAGTASDRYVTGAEAKEQLKAKLNGENEIPPVSTTVDGKLKLKVKESNIKYKLNITGISDATAANIHLGKAGENGEAIVDLLADGNKMNIENGLFINGSIKDSSLIGSMKGKTLAELVSKMNTGSTYVNVNTQAHPEGEIRGQIEMSPSNETSSGSNQTPDKNKTESPSLFSFFNTDTELMS